MRTAHARGLLALLILFLSFFISAAKGASFDCAKAGTAIEKQICADPFLSKLDDALGSNYRRMNAVNIGDGARKDLRLKQIEWLKFRNKCQSKSCLVDAYLNRIDEICTYPVLTGFHPGCIESSEFKETNKKNNIASEPTNQTQTNIDKCVDKRIEREKKISPAITRFMIETWRSECEQLMGLDFSPIQPITAQMQPTAAAPPKFDDAFTAWENKNYTTAFQLALELTKKNDPLAQWLISVMYRFGDGVAKNHAEAINWARKSAEQGNLHGQELLASYYEKGIGVEKNLYEALRWYRLAAAQGDEDSQTKVAQLSAELANNTLSEMPSPRISPPSQLSQPRASSLADKFNKDELISKNPELLFSAEAKKISSQFPDRSIFRCSNTDEISFGDIIMLAIKESSLYVQWIIPMLELEKPVNVKFAPKSKAISWNDRQSGVSTQFELHLDTSGKPTNLYTAATGFNVVTKYKCSQILR